MKALPSIGRNDVIRAIALISVVAFPLIADAQLGLGARAVQRSDGVVTAPVPAAVARRDSCADQHWPFFSKACLRGSADIVEPRLVERSVDPVPSSAKAARSAKADTPGDLPVARSKKIAKSRVATHSRERRSSPVTYAVNSDSTISLAGW
ncbi:hypothetical protein [uncultured Bradyrhizobium sp.]|uniref:hypothetical protein n=1 Tax=uncultured Bradyrhizobium sp. TaxID=199684 RepID=UPI0035C9CE6E